MNRNIKKSLAVGIISLLIVASLIPVVNSQILKNEKPKSSYESNQESIDVTVFEYKPDGTIEKNVVEMPLEKAKELKERLTGERNLEKQLPILKEYGIISENVTLEKMRKGMEEKAKRMGLIKQRLDKIAFVDEPNFSDGKLFGCHYNFLCEVNEVDLFNLNIPIGSSLLTGPINWVLVYIFGRTWLQLIRSLDLSIVSLTSFNQFYTNGIMGRIDSSSLLSAIFLLGFIGLYVKIPIMSIWSTFYWGYTAVALWIGLGVIY
jgi:hypothetical protein